MKATYLLNSAAILHESSVKMGQSDEFVGIYRIDGTQPCAMAYHFTVRVAIHRDRSYDNQSRAHIDVWCAPSLTWNTVAWLPYPNMRDDKEDTKELLRLAQIVLK